MSTVYQATKPEWLVICPDFEGAVEKRMAVRPQHIEAAKDLMADGKMSLGGGFFDHHPTPSETVPSFRGSALVYEAETKEEVLEIVKKDIYAREGVWDVSKIQVFPVKFALRK
ncbi:hypothetical protein YB2330_005778 [Saitoella coloradoensis]